MGHPISIIFPFIVQYKNMRVALLRQKKPDTSSYQTNARLMEQVTRIELAYSAWKADVLPLNYTCMVGKTGFEPAASWSQTKRSTKLSYFPIA